MKEVTLSGSRFGSATLARCSCAEDKRIVITFADRDARVGWGPTRILGRVDEFDQAKAGGEADD